MSKGTACTGWWAWQEQFGQSPCPLEPDCLPGFCFSNTCLFLGSKDSSFATSPVYSLMMKKNALHNKHSQRNQTSLLWISITCCYILYCLGLSYLYLPQWLYLSDFLGKLHLWLLEVLVFVLVMITATSLFTCPQQCILFCRQDYVHFKCQKIFMYITRSGICQSVPEGPDFRKVFCPLGELRL